MLKVCEAFKAFLPVSKIVPFGIRDLRVVTVWPTKDERLAELDTYRYQNTYREFEDCKNIVSSYDLDAGISALQKATNEGAKLTGEGPFLLGWSKSPTSGQADKAALIVDFSNFETQEGINGLFLFWQNKVIADPTTWSSGFSTERLRLSLREYADRYGEDILEAVKLTSPKH